MDSELRLEVSEYKDPDHWLWRLKDGEGNFIASQQVSLAEQGGEDCHYRGYCDLPRYLDSYRVVYGEKGALDRVGRWMGEHVLGNLRKKLGERLKAAGQMLPVRLVVPECASELVLRPLELAWLKEGKSLAEAGARLIWQREGQEATKHTKDSDGPLRVLGVFSLPTDVSPLNLRKERVAFQGLLHTIAATGGVAIQPRVVQYGTTLGSLKKIISKHPGWDIVHFSCHGSQGNLWLEDETGKAYPVPAEELGRLLKPIQPRLKLVILSACWSGAGITHAQAREMLRLPRDGGQTLTESGAMESTVLPSLAEQLSSELDCAVVAMRFPVGDDFAIDLTSGLFYQLLENGQPLACALQLSLDEALGDGRGDTFPALSPITPMLYGASAGQLKFAPPREKPDFELPVTGLQSFPRPPEHFVGRVGPMLRASQALAPESGKAGVLFYGMAGGGKTACAVELAHLHEYGRFQGFVWFRCPNEGEDIQNALLNCLDTMANQLGEAPGAYIGNVGDPRRFRETTASRLKGLFKKSAILVVIDNMESLMFDDGNWRDEKWGDFMSALVDHGGLSRAVLTSRRVPAELRNLQKENVTALSLRESLLLARELPNLRALLEGGEETITLIRDALEVIQGHPKLLEFAEKLATNVNKFKQIVEYARQATQDGGAALTAFFELGESNQELKDFTAALKDWTTRLVATLTPTARLAFWFLCRLEGIDRRRSILRANWKRFLRHAAPNCFEAKNALDEPECALEPALDAIVRSGLADETSLEMDALFRIHPGVAEAAQSREQHNPIAESADLTMCTFHRSVRAEAAQIEGTGTLVVDAARRALPYAMRCEQWTDAAIFLQEIMHRDPSPTTTQWVLPYLEKMRKATRQTPEGPVFACILAKGLIKASRYSQAEAVLQESLAQLQLQGEWQEASAAAGYLIDILMIDRLSEALKWVANKVEFTKKAGLGCWTQLADEGEKLRILCAMGQYQDVLDALPDLYREIELQRKIPHRREMVEPWNVWESTLNTGCRAAIGLKNWSKALELNAQIRNSMRNRGANSLVIAKCLLNDYMPLLRLRRFSEMREMLDHCKRVFEVAEDHSALGRVYTAFAELECAEKKPGSAAKFEAKAMAYTYLAPLPNDCAASHNNLATYLARAGQPTRHYLPHQIAAALLQLPTNSNALRDSLHNLVVSDLPATPPAFEDVVQAVERVDGVRFRELFERLPKEYADGDAAIQALWEMVKQEKAHRAKAKRQTEVVLTTLPPGLRAAVEESDAEALLKALDSLSADERAMAVQRLKEIGIDMKDRSDNEEMVNNLLPLLEAIAAVALGQTDDDERLEIEQELEWGEQHGWHLRDVAHRIWAGERDGEALTAGLDEQDAALVRRVLELIG